MDKQKCEALHIFKRPNATGYIEAELVTKKRMYVCDKCKEYAFVQNEKDSFRNPSFTPRLTFYPLEENN